MLKTPMVRSTLVTLVCSVTFAAHAMADAPKPIDVPAGELVVALEALSRQAAVDLVFQPDQLRSFRTDGVSGTYSPQDAIRILLKGTPLQLRTDASSGAMVIASPIAPKTSSLSSQGEGPDGEGSALAGDERKSFWSRLRLAQAGSSSTSKADTNNPAPSKGEGQGEDEREARSPKVIELEEIVVTGTNIRGADPLSPVIRATRDEIIAQGYTRVDQYIQQLPQSFAGGGASQRSNPVPGGGGGEGSNNYAFASGINLRGLGANATLTLLNGHRLPPTALGTSVDVSRIPLSAIERVEILMDGASATYGADAVAGVANFITRKQFDGFEVGARADSYAEGKSPGFGSHALGGHSWNTGSVLLSFDYNKENELLAKDRPFASGLDPVTMLLPQIETSSGYLSARQEISDRAVLSIDTLASRRTFNATYAAFGVDSRNFGGGNQVSVNTSLAYAISDRWRSELTASIGDEKDDFTIDQGGSAARGEYDYKTQAIDARVEGPLFVVPAGAVRSAFGASVRREKYGQGGASAAMDSTRKIGSFYGELYVPLVAADAGIPLISELKASLSGRYDDYDDFGDTANPKIAMQWSPLQDLAFRASYGRSFRAPTLSQLDPNALQIGYVFDVPDPAAPAGVRRTLLLDNTGNPDLKAEKSRSLTFGLEFAPSSIPGLSLDISYFDIKFDDKVIQLSSHGLLNVLVDAEQYGGYLNLAPTLAEVDRALAIPGLLLLDFNDPPGFVNSDIAAIASLGYTNAASVHPKGVDLSARYQWQTGLGEFSVSPAGSYLLSYESRFAPSAQPGEGVDRLGEPPRFRGKLHLSWERGPFAAYSRVNYTKRYHNQLDLSCGDELGCTVASFTTLDIGVSYTPDALAFAGFNGLRLGLDVFNLLDEGPPFVAASDAHYDGANASPLGRAAAVTVSKKW